MPRFRIQSNLHLDGFQMLDACLENVTSFEGLSDKNTGRIVFLNGSSSNKSNLHPAVFYGNEFKGLAYLDDIDKITNGEGSLGTRVKALEDMLNVDSAETVVSTWEEIQAFLDNVKEGTDLMTMLDGKLDRTGGVMELDSSESFIIKRKTESGSTIIKFANNNGTLGYLGVDSTAPVYYNAKGNKFTIIHSGNYSDLIEDTYLKTDGSKIMTAPIKFSAGSVDYDAVGDGLAVLYTSSANNAPNNDEYGRTLSVVNGSAGFQLGIAQAYPTLYYRAKNSNSWSEWKAVAFTDSDITGNAATATKLKDKVSLWGNEFDGTQNLDNAQILLNNARAIYWKAADKTTNIESIVLNNGGSFLIGQGVAKAGGDTIIYGNNIKFCYGTLGTSANTAMTITDEGNVLVGVASQTNTDFKFEVSGLSRIYTAGQSMSLGKVPTSGLVLGSSTGLQGQFYFDYSGNICLQGQSVSDSTTRALNLNPLGGAVNVGDGGLKVAGNVIASKINSDVSISVENENGKIGLYTSENRGVYDFSTNMWVLGTNGTNTFLRQGNVIIGGHIDDESGARLQVTGLSAFNGGALIPTGQKLTIGDANGDHATIEYDSIAKAIKVDGNLFTTGTNASGGKADAQQGGTGGSAEVYRHDLDWGEQVYEIRNDKGDVNVNVQVYEWNGNGNSWDMILTDVSVTANIITVTFGRPTSVDHMVTVV